MTRLLPLLLLCLAATQPDLWLADDGRIEVRRDAEWAFDHPYFNWESGLTKFETVRTETGCKIQIKVDVHGSPWMHLDIEQGNGGVTVRYELTGTGNDAPPLIETYCDWDEAIHDDCPLMRVTVFILKRFNISTHLESRY